MDFFFIIILFVQVVRDYFFLVEENKKSRVHVFILTCSVILPYACEFYVFFYFAACQCKFPHCSFQMVGRLR